MAHTKTNSYYIKKNIYKMKLISWLNKLSPNLAIKTLGLSNNIIIQEKAFLKVWWQLVNDNKIFISIREAYNIYSHLSKAISLGGVVAEFGVYKGGTAKLISEFKQDSKLLLFDTFGGMPEVSAIDLHKKGDFADTSLEQVQIYLKDYSNIDFHKGLFSETINDLPSNTEFCFVHLDVDIYESTFAGLSFFYPKMKRGGIIISHDYHAISCPGVKKAFHEYFANYDVKIIHLWDSQAMVIKL